MLGKAHTWGLSGIAPKIRLQKEKRRTLLIGSEREQQLLSFARQPLRDVLVIMQDTGLRPDEVLKKQRRTPPAKQSGLVAWCRSVNAC